MLTSKKKSPIMQSRTSNKATKNQAPSGNFRFAGVIADILLADTYIIAAKGEFVKVKFLISDCGGGIKRLPVAFSRASSFPNFFTRTHLQR